MSAHPAASHAPDPADLAALVSHALRAPSSHNTQPWRFRIRGDTIDLFADRTRALPVNDPDDRELTLSCGCALMHLRVAAAAAGSGTEVHRLPATEDPDWLASVQLVRATPAADEARLFPAIAQRRTWRQRFADQPVAPEHLQQFEAMAQADGGWLHVLHPEPIRAQAAALVAEGDAMQWADPSWRRELAAWMHPRRRGDGLTVPALAQPVAQIVVRTFDLGGGVGAKDRQLAEASPVLAVLGTPGDGVEDWLRAGEALARLLLAGCLHGLQASYLNQPIQVAALRPKLQHLIGRPGFAQVLLRIGHAEGTLPAAPRRPLDDMLEPAG